MGAAAFTICETFSSKVIRETRSSTRFSIGSEGSLYGGKDSWALMPNRGEASDNQIRISRLIRPQIERFSVGADLRVPGAASLWKPGQTRRSAPTLIWGLLNLQKAAQRLCFIRSSEIVGQSGLGLPGLLEKRL